MFLSLFSRRPVAPTGPHAILRCRFRLVLASLLACLLTVRSACGWEIAQSKDPLSDATVLIASASAKSENRGEPHTLRIRVTIPNQKVKPGALPTVDVELSRVAGAASGSSEKQLTFRWDQAAVQRCTWTPLENHPGTGMIEFASETEAIAPVAETFDRLEAQFKAVWYPQAQAARAASLVEARQKARLKTLLAGKKQLAFTSLTDSGDAVVFPLDKNLSELRKHLVTALDAYENRQPARAAELKEVQVILQKKQAHAELVAERKRKAERYVATARSRVANVRGLKERLADEILAAVSAEALPSAGFDAKCQIEACASGTVRVFRPFPSAVPPHIATAFENAIARVGSQPKEGDGHFFECHLTFVNNEIGVNIAQIDPPSADDRGQPPGSLAPQIPKVSLPLDLSTPKR